jgi:flagellar biosynthesis/type III secretory pathway chaperone
MTTAGVQDRDLKATEYLQTLRSLTHELEKAMQAIARNALPELEESIDSQQVLSARLNELADDLCVPLQADATISQASLDDEMKQQIRSASQTLQRLNQRYAALLRHSSRSVAQMASLFSSFQGKFQEASGPRLKHQTWSCQM